METTAATEQIILGLLPIGGRLIVRSKKDWRVAVISRITPEKVTLIVCSPFGRTYRLHRKIDCEIIYDGRIAVLKCDSSEDSWRENFTKYDFRW